MSPVRVAFRVDASFEIGTGHVIRCLTLANALKSRGIESEFLSRNLPGNINSIIREHGFVVYELDCPKSIESSSERVNVPHSRQRSDYTKWLQVDPNQDISETANVLRSKCFDWLVIDHYAIDLHWEKEVQKVVKKIFVIDDLANRPHQCDLLLDQTLGRCINDYGALVSKKTSLLLGPQYALLRTQFFDMRLESVEKRREPRLRKILISLGGIDKENITADLLRLICRSQLLFKLGFEVVLGKTSPWIHEIKILSESLPYEAHLWTDVRDMASLMLECDMAIGSAGTSNWERCCLGLPTILIVTAENQTFSAKNLETSGAVILAKTVTEIPDLLEGVLLRPDLSDFLSSMSQAAFEITDGKGADRVAQKLG